MVEKVTIPALASARLDLHGHTEIDLDAAAAMWAHEDVVRFIGGRPFTREEVWHRILRYVGHWELKRYGYWTIVEHDGGRFVGEIGFADWKRAQLANYEGVPECGWALAPEMHRRGYASEALAVVLKWADAILRCPTICLISEANARSIRLAERNGYRTIDRTEDGAQILRRELDKRREN